MLNKIAGIIKRDLKPGSRFWFLFIMAFIPLILIVIMILGFPPLAKSMFTNQNFDLYVYYSLIAITIISVISALPGLFYAFHFLGELRGSRSEAIGIQDPDPKLSLRVRTVLSFLVSLAFLLIFIRSTDPVPGEGWLRIIYISLLFALQSPFAFLFVSCLAGNRRSACLLSLLYALFIVVVPVGLVLHHPWNYLAFFSPFYWIAWAWIIETPFESLLYGTISLMITMVSALMFCSHLFRKVLK